MLFEFIFQVEPPSLTSQRHAPINAYTFIEVVFERLGWSLKVLDALSGEVFFGLVPLKGLHRGFFGRGD